MVLTSQLIVFMSQFKVVLFVLSHLFFHPTLPPNSNPPTPSPRGAENYLQVGQLRADLPDPLASVPDRLEGTRGTGPGLLDGLRQGEGAGGKMLGCDLHVDCVVIKCLCMSSRYEYV